MSPIIILAAPKAFEMNSPTGYLIGAVLALIILGLLAYSLIKPEKF